MWCSVYNIDIDKMSRFKTICFIHLNRNDEKVVNNRYKNTVMLCNMKQDTMYESYEKQIMIM